jgi:hypothetical protein
MFQYFFDFDGFDFHWVDFASFDSADVSSEPAVDTGADVLTSSDSPTSIALDDNSVASDTVDASETADVTSADLTDSMGADQGTDLVDTSGVIDYFWYWSDFADASTAAAVDMGADVLTSSDTANWIALDDGGVAFDPADAGATPDMTSADLTESMGADGAMAEQEECVQCKLGGFYDEVDSQAAITVEDISLFGLDIFA